MSQTIITFELNIFFFLGLILYVSVHLRLDRLLEGKNLVDVPVVLKTPARKSYI